MAGRASVKGCGRNYKRSPRIHGRGPMGWLSSRQRATGQNDGDEIFTAGNATGLPAPNGSNEQREDVYLEAIPTPE